MASISITPKSKTKHTNIGELRNAIEIVVKMLANKGIKVTQSGIRAYVQYDEKTLEATRVNIPSISEKSSPDLVTAIKGFVDHEVAHILFTDSKMVARAHKEKIANLHNIVEDTFIEAKMKKTFAGSTRNIDKTVEFAVKHFFQKTFDHFVEDFRADKDASQAMFFVKALATPGIRALAGQEIAKDFMTDKWELIPEVYTALLPLSKKLQTINSSFESLKMANTIRDLLAEVEREQKEKEEDEGGEDGDEGEDGSPSPSSKGGSGCSGDDIFDKDESEKPEGKDESESDEEGSSGKDEESESEESGDEEESDRKGDMIDERDSESSDAGTSTGEEGDSTSDKTTGDDRERGTDEGGGDGHVLHDGNIEDHPELSEALEKMETYDSALESAISEGAMDALETQSYMPYSSEKDSIEVYKIKPGSSVDLKSKARQEKLRLKIGEQIGVMSKALERLLMARNRSMFVPGFKSGRLHSSSLYKLHTGDTRVFRRKEEVRTKNTAVLLLVDCSGSMNYRDRIVKASDAAYALCSSLERVGVKTQVVGFTTSGDYELASEAKKEVEGILHKTPTFKGGFDRVEPLVMPIYKTFDERLTPACEQRIAAIPFLELRNNADGECVEIAANMLRARQEERKILVVLSDGSPAMANVIVGGGSSRGGEKRAEVHLKNVVADTEASGIEVLGIGIETYEVEAFYPKSIVLDDVSELPTKIVSELSAMLLR